MRPSFEVRGVGTFREITLWKAILLSIVTFGVYHLVVTYQNTRDIQQARAAPFEVWQLLFWLGLLFGPFHYVLYGFNGVGLKEFRQVRGQKEDGLWIAALVLSIILFPVGQIIWAVSFNGWLHEQGTPVEAPAGAAAPQAA